MTDPRIPFSRPWRARNELENLQRVLESGHVHGDGHFTQTASEQLSQIMPAPRVLLTPSGTHALELATLLLEVGPGDEVILPTFTFPSAATAITQTGGVPVFVDIDDTTGNIDPETIAAAVTPRTKAISIVHYAGVAARMDEILEIASSFGLPVIEDNAHGLAARYHDRMLGTIGAVAAQSFHDTKNVHSGEGGAAVINDPALVERAEIIREKGTNRAQFLRGQVDKYTWRDVGSSYLMSELNAALLSAQLDEFDEIQARRHHVWDRYKIELAEWAGRTQVRLMDPPAGTEHPAHLFYLTLADREDRDAFLAHLRQREIIATFHFVPLDSSPAGQRFARSVGTLHRARDFSDRLARLPLWPAMTETEIGRVIEAVMEFTPRGSR